MSERAGAGITDAALTGGQPTRRPRPAPRLDIDEEAFRRERMRPAATVMDEPEAPPGPNWMLRIVGLLVALLGLALVYQFVVRPLLK